MTATMRVASATFAVIFSTASWWWCRWLFRRASRLRRGRTDEVEDVDLELGVALGLGGCFGAGFAFAFAFAAASVSWIKNREEPECQQSPSRGLQSYGVPTQDVGPRAALNCCTRIASKSLMIIGRGSFLPFCRIKCITAMRRTCGRHAQMMSTASRVTVFRQLTFLKKYTALTPYAPANTLLMNVHWISRLSLTLGFFFRSVGLSEAFKLFPSKHVLEIIAAVAALQ